jgi:AMP nucleosidase
MNDIQITNIDQIEKLIDQMIDIDNKGYYSMLTVKRNWSTHNPILSGEFSSPQAYRYYLYDEIFKVISLGAQVSVEQSRQKLSLDDIELLKSLDERDFDLRKKKLYLFSPERVDLSLSRLKHYTGTDAKDFQRHIIFTNYDMHMEVFGEMFPQCIRPENEQSVQMPAYHYKQENNTGYTIIKIGVGPANAKTITDHIAVLKPESMIMIGHCGGLRNHQNIGDFVIASSYMRDDKIFDDIVPLNIPIIPHNIINNILMDTIHDYSLDFRIGLVFTTDNRNWEFLREEYLKKFAQSRSIAIDMESATIACNGFRYRIPNATLLSVSDKPLHGKPKLSEDAKEFYLKSKKMHLSIVIDAIKKIRQNYPAGFPSSTIRGPYESLF